MEWNKCQYIFYIYIQICKTCKFKILYRANLRKCKKMYISVYKYTEMKKISF